MEYRVRGTEYEVWGIKQRGTEYGVWSKEYSEGQHQVYTRPARHENLHVVFSNVESAVL